MKITKKQLRGIIKEELSRFLKEEGDPVEAAYEKLIKVYQKADRSAAAIPYMDNGETTLMLHLETDGYEFMKDHYGLDDSQLEVLLAKIRQYGKEEYGMNAEDEGFIPSSQMRLDDKW